MSRVVVFGTGSFAEVVSFYLEHDSPHEVVAYTADEPAAGSFLGRPLVPFATLADTHPPGDHELFVAVGYRDVNRVRAAKCEQARALGYTLVTYVCSKATTWPGLAIGDNGFVFEDNTIQPFVTIGDGVVLWSGNHVGHHARIGDYCFLTSHVVVSGHTRIGERSFVGVNATLRDDIEIGAGNVIGAGAIVMRSTGPGEVWVPRRTERFHTDADGLGM